MNIRILRGLDEVEEIDEEAEKEDVEAALERLLGSVTIHTAEPILRPA